MSSNRIIVDAKVYDDFVQRFVAHVQKLKCGDPRDPDTVIGPIINSSQLRNMLDLMKQSRQAGARQVFRRRSARVSASSAGVRRRHQ